MLDDIPDNVIEAFDAGNRIFTLVQVDLKPAHGGTVRWTDSPANLVWESATWNSLGDFMGIDDAFTEPGEEGTMSIVLADRERGWFTRLNSSGPRGRAVKIRWLIGLDEAPWLYQFGGFDGTTQAARFTHSEEGSPETRLVVMDKLYYNYLDTAEMTSNAYQRSLDPTDDSHIIAHSSRKLPWHT